ncbi:DEAD/DEAH box helicase [Clostridium sp. P21]|uniref:DEAD/DEAH box helicase n=1 Tax=Clostridium muellerianum TaxID=2716538 RepID=A0A7Y0EHE1_9CLOT|nr:DEAD/DEAH box helicase [Clostridium muellerianum]NMM63441.1 DEAD/DEAH box helicase [Clostridium muellerianum]
MNLKELEETIFKPSSNFMRKSGKKIFKEGFVSNIKGKNIGNTYHIYGDVCNSNSEKTFKTHIKLDLQNKKLEDVSCSCNDFREISMNKKLFMCEHLTASAYKFLSLFYKKAAVKSGLAENNKKVELNIDVKITHKYWKGTTNYELEFRCGIEHKYLIMDLKNFILHIDNKTSISFNNQFIYNPKKHVISPETMKIIDFIRDHINRNKGLLSVGRNLIIEPKELRTFLKCICGSKIIFKYNAIEYKSLVINEDLPLSFTLKERNERFILTTHKKLPITLNESNDVYLFNDKIYLPSKNQIEKYTYFYNKFKIKNEIMYAKTMENYNKIIFLLSNISNDITISESVKRFGSNSFKLEFFIYKEGSNIYCDASVIYNSSKFNILEDAHSKEKLIRNFNKEEKVIMRLESYKFIKRESRFMFIGDDEDLFAILTNAPNSIHSLGNVVIGKGLKNKVYDSSFMELDLCEEDGYLKLNYNIENVQIGEFNRIFESYKSNNKFYKTENNGFIDFEDEGIRSFFNLIQTLNINESVEDSVIIEKNKALYVAPILNNKSFKFKRGSELLQNLENKIKNINNKEIETPKDLKAVLREYQLSGFKWLKNLSNLELGGILADEMGLGKTIQTIAFITSEESKKTLIITPTSLIYNWKDEIKKFAPTLNVGIAYGSSVKHENIIDENNVILTTYGTLKNNIDKYKNVEFDYCIIDEAQNIKNDTAQNTITVKSIKAKVRFALTGTPIENNLMELWSIFDFIMPGYLYSKQVFEKKFINDDCDLDNLKLSIKPFILRRTKKEVIKDLPDKIEKKILVEMASAQKSIYSAYIKDVRTKVKNNSQGKIEIFSYLTRLRQICLDPSIVFNEYKGGNGKLKVALSLVEEHIDSSGKILLFSQFTSVLKKIRESLQEKDIDYFYLDGSTASKERVKLVNEFNSSDNVKVFLISLKAGGTGLNLTSANLVIHFDPWWNPAVEDQATDRAHRIGQKSVVEVIKLVARGTIEEKIISLQENKKELIHNIITGELKNSSMINKLTREELVQLFDR